MSTINHALSNMKDKKVQPLINKWMAPSVLALTSLLAGCNSSSETVASEQNSQIEEVVQQEFGDLVLALTDAEEDFVSYTVDVSSILLTKQNGDQIEVLPEKTQVDFVEYQELTELFALVKAPVGSYSSVVMELDYSNAYVLIQDEEGETHEAQMVDVEGNLLTTHLVEFQLSESQDVVVDALTPRYLTLDLDLSASNTIVSFEPAVVEVEAFVSAELSLDTEREHRLRGTISEVSTAEQTVTLNVKPMRKEVGAFGEITINFDDESQIEVDGESVELSAALSTLSEQNDTYPVLAFGVTSLNSETGEYTFVADSLLAGSSVPWFGKDLFKGMVSNLEEGVSYISGLMVDTEAKSRMHLTDVALSLSDETSFVSHFNKEVDASFLVPGQRIKTAGDYQASENDGQVITSFDISGEMVRILQSEVIGQVTDISDNTMTVEVERFNKRPKHLIKKAKARRQLTILDGSPVLDEIVIDISELSLLSLETNDWIKVKGLMLPVAADTDMQALAISKYDIEHSVIRYAGHYGQEGSTPIIAETHDAITLDLTTGRHKMNFRFHPVNVMPEVEQVTIVSAEQVTKLAIVQSGEETVFYDDFNALMSALASKLEDMDTVKTILASGSYSQELAVYEVTDLVVKLN